MMRHPDMNCATCKVVSKYNFDEERYEPEICDIRKIATCPNYRAMLMRQQATENRKKQAAEKSNN